MWGLVGVIGFRLGLGIEVVLIGVWGVWVGFGWYSTVILQAILIVTHS